MPINIAQTAPIFHYQPLQHHLEARIDEYLQKVSPNGDHILHGRQSNRDSIQLISNDYLCLSAEPSLIAAQVNFLQGGEAKENIMSAVFLHGPNSTRDFERKMSDYVKSEDGIVCQSGYSANVGLLQAIALPQTPVYLDFKAHASLWDGVTAAGAKPCVFMHNDLDDLRREIAKNGPGIICVDSVYSTTGSVCPLVDLVEIAEQTGNILIVDESHSVGTHGPQGAGIVVEHGLQDRVHFRTFSLAKAFAGRGGFVTCSSRFKGYFSCHSRHAIFSSCLLGVELAYFSAAIDFLNGANDRRKRLMQGSNRLRGGLSALGYNVNTGTEQIIALEPGELAKTRILRDALQEHNIFGAVFYGPATADKRTIVRFTVNSGLTNAQIDRVIDVCSQIRERVDMAEWRSTKKKIHAARHANGMAANVGDQALVC